MNYRNYKNRLYTGLTGTKMKSTTKICQILNYINDNNGATKYECVTNVLNKTGSKQDLRGYYCCAFNDLVEQGICDYTRKGYQYTLTTYGAELLRNANNR